MYHNYHCHIPLQNTEKPLTDVDKVKKFLLAPSTLDPHSFLNVVNALFKKPIPALKYFPDLLFSSPYTSTSPTTSNPATSSQATSSSPATTSAATSSATVKKVQLVLNETMKELHYKEACGIPLLGVFVAHLAKTLTDTTSFEILADMEFSVVTHKLKSGVKPASDAAMVVALVYAVKPVLLYEYKPVVDPRVDRIERKALIEVLLQGFYCLYQHNVTTVIHCLTDLSQWYYFKLEKEKPSNMKIVWFQSIHEEELNLHTHFSFLEPVVTNELLPMHTLYSSLEHTCM